LCGGFIKIAQPVDGAILNRHDGKQRSDGLEVEVRLIAPRKSGITVNGVEAEVVRGPMRFYSYGPKGGLYNEFSCNIILKELETRIVACADNSRTSSTVITVLWDENSIRRYRFSVDNNILFLKDLAVNARKYNSIFENDYMNFWRQIHQEYGTRIQFNIYYQTEEFNLSQVPSKYKSEWEENSNWLRLTFHALHGEPKPYINASYRDMERDFRLVSGEIERFAGKSLLSTFTTVHWGETTLEACRALRDNGIKGLVGYFTVDPENGKPTVSYYLGEEETKYLREHDYWKDTREDLIFIKHDLVINDVDLEDIIPALNSIASDPHQSEVMEVMVHEEYFRPELHSYEADIKERVEITTEWLTKNGYKSVFYDEGFLGSPQ